MKIPILNRSALKYVDYKASKKLLVGFSLIPIRHSLIPFYISSYFRRKYNRLSLGLTLIEVPFSALIFGLCLVPIFDVIGKGAAMARTSREEVLASSLAAELIDQIRTIPFNKIPPLTERPLKNSDNGALLLESQIDTLLVLSLMPKDFERLLSIEPVSSKIKRITARITWGEAPRHEVVMMALLEWTP